ncbi:MAG: hypothetical protein AVDCRST_MAG51-656, partial [uncultured Ramlibacter sp.]
VSLAGPEDIRSRDGPFWHRLAAGAQCAGPDVQGAGHEWAGHLQLDAVRRHADRAGGDELAGQQPGVERDARDRARQPGRQRAGAGRGPVPPAHRSERRARGLDQCFDFPGVRGAVRAVAPAHAVRRRRDRRQRTRL